MFEWLFSERMEESVNDYSFEVPGEAEVRLRIIPTDKFVVRAGQNA